MQNYLEIYDYDPPEKEETLYKNGGGFVNYYSDDTEESSSDYYNDGYDEEDDENDDYLIDEFDVEEETYWPYEEELEAYEEEDQWYSHEGFGPFDVFEDDHYLLDNSGEMVEGFREVLHEEYENAPYEQVEEALFNILDSMAGEEGFSFKKALKKIGRAAKKIQKNKTIRRAAQKGLPMAGAAVGTYFGGPAGTAIGNQLGQKAGQAFSPGDKQKARPNPSNKRKMMSGKMPASPPASAQGGSDAAAKLIQLMQNNDALKSIYALALGSHGKQSIKTEKTGEKVPIGAVMNLFSKLFSEAANDADELLRADHTPSYLLDSENEFLVDPAVPEDRAEALYESLMGIN